MRTGWMLVVALGLMACGASGNGANGGSSSSGGSSSGTSSNSTSSDGAIQTCSGFMNPDPCPDDCVDGYCMAKTSTTCHVTDGPDDGCGPNAICRDPGICVVAPACPANGICPAPANDDGDVTCNTGVLPGKGAICIPGRCLSDADCHDGPCVRERTTDVLGHCYIGAVGTASDGDGTEWETIQGCEMKPRFLLGKGAAGTACTDPGQCAPTCCSCEGGQSAALAAKCTYGPGVPLKGTCAPASEACGAVMQGGNTGLCAAP